MNYLKIQNDGLLDIRLVALMGGTTKSGDEFKIGQFGTGLKYVLAFLFRTNNNFKIFIGSEEVKIDLQIEEISGDRFEIICINGNRTSITTKMGMEWSEWMIVRELYSNALDEGGAFYGAVNDCSGEDGKTTFYLELTPNFMRVFNDWNKYFIIGNVPLFENDRFAIHPSSQNLKIYKHGILIHESEQKSIFNYDIKNAPINEMREYRGSLSYDVFNCLKSIDKKAITYFLENCTDKHYEGDMDYDWHGTFAKEWGEAIGTAKIIYPEAVENIRARGVNIDLSDTITIPKKVYKALVKQFDGIGALRVAAKVGDFFQVHNEDLELRIKKCLSILESCGYFMEPDLTYVFGVFGDQVTLAKISIDNKEIMISEKHADKSLFDTCTMLIEENEHYRTGFDDCSREFQQHFINLFAKTLFDKNEVTL